MSKRDQNVMIRLNPIEHGSLLAAKPEGEDLAAFARRLLLGALGPPASIPPLREAAALIIAALSPEIEFDEALSLYDDHVPNREGATTDGRLDQ